VTVRLTIFGALIFSAAGWLLVEHAQWLSKGPRDPRFVRFMRRYDRRADAASRLPPQGRAVDCRGVPLDETLSGDRFQKVLNDCAVVNGGRPVRLTLDGTLQQEATRLMAGRFGAVVVMEPSTGRLRALVSSPASDSLNRALNGVYPPGSVFKIFLAAAALSAGEEPIFHCPAAGYRSARGTMPIRDVEAVHEGRAWRGFGRIGMGEAMIHSANTYFAQLGGALGTERFDEAVRAAKWREGVDVWTAPSGLALTAAANRVPEGVPAPALAPLAIGQGALQMTPLGVAMLTAAVANDGLLIKPSLAEDDRPVLRARPFTMTAAGRVRTMMRAVVRTGTGRACEIPGLDVCGKTGTAQTGRGADHAWFTCFAPQRSPRLAVTVLVENGGFGAQAALPVAKTLLLEARRLGYFP
jgi:peptidoglycan glycosyltransferase